MVEGEEVRKSKYGDITSLEQLMEIGNYHKIHSEVSLFLNEITNEIRIDTVVGKDRKGIWIVRDFLKDNPGFTKYVLSSEETLDKKMIQDLSVLIFDDSIHTGNTVIEIIEEITPLRPKSIVVACLLANKAGIENIQKRCPGIKIKTCKDIFPEYELQSEVFAKWEICLLNGIRTKENPDFNSLTLVTNSLDLEGIANALVEFISESFHVEYYHNNESFADFRQSRSITFRLDTKDARLLPKPYDSICNPGWAKFRIYIRKNGNSSEIVVTPMVSPSVDAKNCKIHKTHPDKCLYMIARVKKNTVICKLCVPALLNHSILIGNIKGIYKKMEEKGHPIIRHNLEMVHAKRFSR